MKIAVPLAKNVLAPLGITAVTKTIENETKEQKGGFLSMLLGTLRASLLGNLLTGKEIERAGFGYHLKGKGIVRTDYGNHSKNKMDF